MDTFRAMKYTRGFSFLVPPDSRQNRAEASRPPEGGWVTWAQAIVTLMAAVNAMQFGEAVVQLPLPLTKPPPLLRYRLAAVVMR